MGRKKISETLKHYSVRQTISSGASAISSGISARRVAGEDPLGIRDLKHDLENHLIKVSQRLESLRRRSPTQDRWLKWTYESVCSSDPGSTADALVFIDRIIHQMFCEFACITILDGGKTGKIDAYRTKIRLRIHPNILRILLLYQSEMSEAWIRYNLSSSDEEWEISEYVFSAIILKIIENCTKYCKPWSSLDIVIGEGRIVFSMMSVKIEYTERDRIFDKGYSGKNTRFLGKSSSGIGLYHAKKLAEFHNLRLSVIPWIESDRIDGCPYAENRFILEV